MEPHEFKKGEVFSMGGWVFKVKKITGEGMILRTLGVAEEKQKEPSLIIMPESNLHLPRFN